MVPLYFIGEMGASFFPGTEYLLCDLIYEHIMAYLQYLYFSSISIKLVLENNRFK